MSTLVYFEEFNRLAPELIRDTFEALITSVNVVVGDSEVTLVAEFGVAIGDQDNVGSIDDLAVISGRIETNIVQLDSLVLVFNNAMESISTVRKQVVNTVFNLNANHADSAGSFRLTSENQFELNPLLSFVPSSLYNRVILNSTRIDNQVARAVALDQLKTNFTGQRLELLDISNQILRSSLKGI